MCGSGERIGGILLQELRGDPTLSRYDRGILDEAHERSINIDLLLGLLRRVREQRMEAKDGAAQNRFAPARRRGHGAEDHAIAQNNDGIALEGGGQFLHWFEHLEGRAETFVATEAGQPALMGTKTYNLLKMQENSSLVQVCFDKHQWYNLMFERYKN